MEYVRFFFCLVNFGRIWGRFTKGMTELFKALTLSLLEMIIKSNGFLEREAKILVIEQILGKK